MTANINGIIELDDNNVIIYLEKTKKLFFGLIDWPERITSFRVFTLSDKDDRRGIEIERFIHGYLGRYGLNYVNIETFDPIEELAKQYQDYLIGQKQKESWNNKIQSFSNKI